MLETWFKFKSINILMDVCVCLYIYIYIYMVDMEGKKLMNEISQPCKSNDKTIGLSVIKTHLCTA